MYLSNFRMPLFFLLSGYNRRPGAFSKERLRRDARRLLVPYVGFWAILYPWWLLAVAPRHGDQFPIESVGDVLLKPFLGLLLGLGHNTAISFSVSAPLWFLTALFVLRTLYDLVFRFLGGASGWLVAATIILPGVAMLLSQAGILLPFSMGSAFLAFPFYAVGVAVRSGSFAAFSQRLERAPSASALFLFALLVPLAWWNGRVDLASMVTGRSLFLFYPSALVGGVGMIAIGLSLRDRTFLLLRLLSMESLSIMALHLVFIAFGKLALRALSMESDFSPQFTGVLLSFFAITTVLPAVIALGWIAPWLTGRGKESACARLCGSTRPSLAPKADTAATQQVIAAGTHESSRG